MLDLEKYFLVKCFSKKEYRETFNNGTKIHINNMKYFWKCEDEFTKDSEGLILKFVGESYMFTTPKGQEELVKNILLSESIEGKSLKEKVIENFEYIATGKDFSISVDGYICCFYILEKSNVYFEEEREIHSCRMFFANAKEQENLQNFLQKYIDKNKTAYVSIYDASKFCQIFCEGMSSKGYQLIIGNVIYQDLTEIEKINLFEQRNFEKLVFTKPTLFDYQREFRIFLRKPKSNAGEFIYEQGIDLRPSLIGTCELV